MGTPNENLLAAEEAVQNLLTTLKDLKREVGEHADSGKLLGAASSRLDRLFEAQSKIGSALESACEATRKIGTTELLEKLDRVAVVLSGIEKEVAKRAPAEEALRERLEKLRSDATEAEKTTGVRHGALLDRLANVDRVEAAVKRAQMLVIWAVGVGAIAAVAAVASLFRR